MGQWSRSHQINEPRSFQLCRMFHSFGTNSQETCGLLQLLFFEIEASDRSVCDCLLLHLMSSRFSLHCDCTFYCIPLFNLLRCPSFNNILFPFIFRLYYYVLCKVLSIALMSKVVLKVNLPLFDPLLRPVELTVLTCPTSVLNTLLLRTMGSHLIWWRSEAVWFLTCIVLTLCHLMLVSMATYNKTNHAGPSSPYWISLMWKNGCKNQQVVNLMSRTRVYILSQKL